METFHSRRAPTYARHGMVASSQPLATQIGLQTLKEGGNAVDAAIAMAAMLNITEPMMNGLGGDAFVMVLWQGKLHGLNASGHAGQAVTAEELRKGAGSICLRLAGEASRYPVQPTAILRYTNASDRKDFADLVEPAACYAEEGVAVSQKAAQFWRWGASKLRLSKESMEQYLVGGQPPKPGEIFRQPGPDVAGIGKARPPAVLRRRVCPKDRHRLR